MTKCLPLCYGSGPCSQPARHAVLSQSPRLPTMDADSQLQKNQDSILSLLRFMASIATFNAVIETINLAKESVRPAKAVFCSVSVLLTVIKVCSHSPATCSMLTYNQDSMNNEMDYFDLGLVCHDVCRALDRGANGKKLDDLGQSIHEVIAQLAERVNPPIHTLESSLTAFLIAGLWQRFEGRSSNRATERGLSTSPCEEWQGNDSRLEGGPQQNPSRLQRAFLHFCVRALLTFHFQTEPIINTNVVVSNVHQGVVYTHAIVSDIRFAVVEDQDGTDREKRSAGVTFILLVAEPILTIP